MTTTITVNNWSSLSVHKITNLFLYGQETTPKKYVDRLRSSQEYYNDNPLIVEIDAVSFMSTGPSLRAWPGSMFSASRARA